MLDLTCAFCMAVLELLFPIITRYMVQEVIPAQNLELLIRLIASLVLLYGLVAVFQYIINYWGHVVGIRMEADMRRDIFSHLQRLSFRFYDRNRTGGLMSRVVNDLNEITELAHHGPEDLFLSTVMLTGSITVLSTIEWRLALAMCALLPAMIWFGVSKRGNMSRAFREVREKIADVNAGLENSISGTRVVQAFTNEEHEIGKFHHSNTRFKEAKYFAYRHMAVFMTGLDLMSRLLYVVVVGFGGYLIYQQMITVGDLLAFLLYIGLVLQPIRRLTNFTQQFERGMSGFRRFCEIMDETPDIRDAPDAVELVHARGDIVFDNVTFSYDNNEHVLKKIAFRVEPGSTLALVGPSGAGKGSVRRKLQQRGVLVYAVSCTTRSPRPGEQEGKHYHFLSEEEFDRLVRGGELVEWAEVYGNYYGTPREPMESLLAAGTDVIVEKDPQGAMTLQERYPDAVYVFILPPSLEELRNRIQQRGTESSTARAQRLASANNEMGFAQQYDYLVVNDDVDEAAHRLRAIITAEKCRVCRSEHILKQVLDGTGGRDGDDEPARNR